MALPERRMPSAVPPPEGCLHPKGCLRQRGSCRRCRALSLSITHRCRDGRRWRGRSTPSISMKAGLRSGRRRPRRRGLRPTAGSSRALRPERRTPHPPSGESWGTSLRRAFPLEGVAPLEGVPGSGFQWRDAARSGPAGRGRRGSRRSAPAARGRSRQCAPSPGRAPRPSPARLARRHCTRPLEHPVEAVQVGREDVVGERCAVLPPLAQPAPPARGPRIAAGKQTAAGSSASGHWRTR